MNEEADFKGEEPNQGAPLEEGEVRITDDEGYIIADRLFGKSTCDSGAEFRFDPHKSLNWRNISGTNFTSLS